MTSIDDCSEWILNEVISRAKGNRRIWFRDPDKLLTCAGAEIRKRISSAPEVLVVKHSLQLRNALRHGLSGHWVLIDQTSDSAGRSQLFAPDLRRVLEPGMIICRTVRDYLIHSTDDRAWPQEVESFPYRELAREHPTEFIRAYEDFRAGKSVGFSSVDLLLIGASAVLQRNLFALENPFLVIELSFHSDDKWKHLTEYFGVDEIQGIRNPVVAEPRFITSVLDVVSAVSASERGESARNGVAASLSERVLDLCKQCLWTDAHSQLSLHAMALPLKG